MIPLFKDDSTSLLGLGTRLAITYNSLTLNSPSDSTNDTYRVDSAESLTSIVAVREERPAGDGSISTLPRKASRIIRLRGVAVDTSWAALWDRAEALAAGTDPAKIALANPTDPFIALDFSVPTTDTTNWATGLIPCRYYALAVGTLDVPVNVGSGKGVPFTIDFFLKDPRRYAQTATTRSGTGSVTHLGDYRSWPTITIAMTGAGSATYSVATTAGTVTLNLSGTANNDSIVIDMDKQTVKKNGTDMASLIVGTPGWFYLDPGATTVTVTNGTNATTTTSFRHAWAD